MGTLARQGGVSFVGDRLRVEAVSSPGNDRASDDGVSVVKGDDLTGSRGGDGG